MSKVMLACALAATAVALPGCGSDDKTAAQTTGTTAETTTTEPSQPTTVTVAVENGAPKGGIVRATFEKGDKVILVVTSDVADEIHLHGYDVSRDVEAGGTVRLPFTATLPGRFEVELESRGVQIADLTVNA